MKRTHCDLFQLNPSGTRFARGRSIRAADPTPATARPLMNDSSRVSGDLKAAPPFHQNEQIPKCFFLSDGPNTALPSNALGSAAATETMRPAAPPSGRPVAVGVDWARPAGWSVAGPAHRPGTETR
jgi:hypothetical protein